VIEQISRQMSTGMLERCSDRGRVPQDRKLLEEVAESHRFGFCRDIASVFVDQRNLGLHRLLGRDRSGKRVAIARPSLSSFSCDSRCGARTKAQKTVNPAPSMAVRNDSG
jgi:hypothetical protein